jgi:hypothetical protein
MMKLVWPALLGIFRTLYFAYSVWCQLFPLALVALLAALAGFGGDDFPQAQEWAQLILGVAAIMAAFAIAYLYWQRTQEDPNPWQSGFMSWFGTLKLFRNDGGAAAVKLHWPSSYLVENPRGYRISGTDLRTLLDLLQPGDILLRGYEGYVDGEFIRRSSLSSQTGFKAGWYTHVALYVGELTESDRAHVPAKFRDDAAYFSTGAQRVIHAMAKGVHTEDILTFLRCDYLTVLRLPAELTLQTDQLAAGIAPSKQCNPPSLSDQLTTGVVNSLQSGKAVLRQQVIHAARVSALEKMGEEYDFDCSDTKEFDRFSCAELLYYCLRGALVPLDLKPLPHAFYPLAPAFKRFCMLERATITPDDYDDLVGKGRMERVWEDRFSKTLK